MSLADVKYLPETPAHDPEIEAINDDAFGPGRFVLAAYKIRSAGPHGARVRQPQRRCRLGHRAASFVG